MPAEDRGGAAVGAPGFGQFARLLFARTRAQPKDAADGFLHREIARGPDVGASFGEEQVDFGRPAADALDAREQGARFLITGGEGVEGPLAVQDELPRALGIALLLPRQAPGAERFRIGRRGSPGGARLP